MKFILIKIIFGFCIVISISACHTFEHQNIFLQNTNKNLNEELMNKKKKKSKVINKEYKENSELAPINTPSQTEKVKKTTLKKKVRTQNTKDFSLKKFVNWNEQKLIKTLGKSDFIKEEGMLKNYQYYLKECFLDIFLLKKKGRYIVDYIETRPTVLNGKIDTNACFGEISEIMN